MMAAPKHVTIKKKVPHNDQVKFWYSKKDLIQTGIAPLDMLKKEAWQNYEKQTVPTNTDGAWKKSDFKKILIPELVHAAENGSLRTVHLDFLVDEENKREILWNLEEAIHKNPDLVSRAFKEISPTWQDIFSSMCTAFARHGAFFWLPPHQILKKPVWIGRTVSGQHWNLFNHIIRIEPHSVATIIMDNRPENENELPSMNIENLQVHIGDGAYLKFIEINSTGKASRLIQHQFASIERDGTLEWIAFASDTNYLKKFIHVDLKAAGAKSRMAGIFIATDDQQFEFDTFQNHQAPNTSSDLDYKGVILGSARTLFKGMINICEEAQKSNSYQSNRNLLLSAHAHADSVPGLEILADDVHCSHGATIGKIDPDEMFYLMSRGISLSDAARLIVNGFFEPLLQRIDDEALRSGLQDRIDVNMDVIQ